MSSPGSSNNPSKPHSEKKPKSKDKEDKPTTKPAIKLEKATTSKSKPIITKQGINNFPITEQPRSIRFATSSTTSPPSSQKPITKQPTKATKVTEIPVQNITFPPVITIKPPITEQPRARRSSDLEGLQINLPSPQEYEKLKAENNKRNSKDDDSQKSADKDSLKENKEKNTAGYFGRVFNLMHSIFPTLRRDSVDSSSGEDLEEDVSQPSNSLPPETKEKKLSLKPQVEPPLKTNKDEKPSLKPESESFPKTKDEKPSLKFEAETAHLPPETQEKKTSVKQAEIPHLLPKEEKPLLKLEAEPSPLSPETTEKKPVLKFEAKAPRLPPETRKKKPALKREAGHHLLPTEDREKNRTLKLEVEPPPLPPKTKEKKPAQKLEAEPPPLPPEIEAELIVSAVEEKLQLRPAIRKPKGVWFWEKMFASQDAPEEKKSDPVKSKSKLLSTASISASKKLSPHRVFYHSDTLPKRRFPSIDEGYHVLFDVDELLIQSERAIPLGLEFCKEVQTNGLELPRVFSVRDRDRNKALIYAVEYSTLGNVIGGCGCRWAHYEFFRQPQQLAFFTDKGHLLLRLVPTFSEVCISTRLCQECRCWGNGGSLRRLIKRYDFVTPDHKVIANLFSDAYFYFVPRYHLVLQPEAKESLGRDSELLLTFLGTCLDCEDHLSFWGFKPPDNEEDVNFYEKGFLYASIKKPKDWSSHRANCLCTVHFAPYVTPELRALIVAQAFLVRYYCWEPIKPAQWGYAGG